MDAATWTQIDLWLNIVIGVPIKFLIDILQAFVVNHRWQWTPRQTALVALALSLGAAYVINGITQSGLSYGDLLKSTLAALGTAGLTQAMFSAPAQRAAAPDPSTNYEPVDNGPKGF